MSSADVQLYAIAHGTSQSDIVAYMHVAGQAARTAAEHLTPSQFRTVAIQAGLGSQVTSHTFTAPSTVAQLASPLNSLPPHLFLVRRHA